MKVHDAGTVGMRQQLADEFLEGGFDGHRLVEIVPLGSGEFVEMTVEEVRHGLAFRSRHLPPMLQIQLIGR